MHLMFGGSTAKRTLGCPGWVNESKNIPNVETEFAKRGTALHECLEEILLEGSAPEDFTGQTVAGVEITPDLVRDKLAPATKAFDDMCDHFGVTEYEAETFCQIADDIGGTADIIARGETGGKTYAIIGDFKFGDGIQVEAEENEQGLFYAMCARQEESLKDLIADADVVVVAIIQPNERDMPELRLWETTPKRVDKFEKEFMRAVNEAKSARPPLNAGSHCQFCPAASICPQRSGEALRALRMDPEDIECLGQSMELVADLKAWIKDVEKTVFEQLNAGATVPGFKLVAKRAIARWEDEDLVLKTFRRRLGGLKHMTQSKLLSPAQMKKLAKTRGKDIDFDEYIVKTSTGNTIAPEDDKRPAVLAGEALAQALKSVA